MNKEKFEEFYKDLTRAEEISLLYGIRGAHALVDIVHYQELKNHPTPKPNPSYLYISSVLDMNFIEFYNDSEIAQKSFKMRAQIDKIKQYVLDQYDVELHFTFIGDAMGS